MLVAAVMRSGAMICVSAFLSLFIIGLRRTG
jgi:hypothetical protein